MGLSKEVELIIIPKKQTSKTIKVKSLNGYDAIREKLGEGNTLSVKTPVEQPTKPKTKSKCWFVIKLNYFYFVIL